MNEMSGNRVVKDDCLPTGLRSGDDFYWGRRFHGAWKRPTQRVVRPVLDRHIAKVSWGIGGRDMPDRDREHA